MKTSLQFDLKTGVKMKISSACLLEVDLPMRTSLCFDPEITLRLFNCITSDSVYKRQHPAIRIFR